MKKTRIKKLIFPIIYFTAAVGGAILGFLSDSFFAYDITEKLWANILYLLCVSALYITAYVSELIDKHDPRDIVSNSFIFLGSLLFFYLFYFLNVYFALVGIFYSAALACYLMFRSLLRIRATGVIPSDSDVDVKPSLAVFAIMLFAMIGLMTTVNYISEIYMVWALIPTAIVSVALGVIAFIIMRKIIAAKLIGVGRCILIVLIAAFVIYAYCQTVLGIANYAFDGSDPTLIECTVLDMNVSGGGRSPTEHELKIKIDNDEMWLDVSPAQYYSITKGDTITVEYYSGAFGFAYLLYNDKPE